MPNRLRIRILASALLFTLSLGSVVAVEARSVGSISPQHPRLLFTPETLDAMKVEFRTRPFFNVLVAQAPLADLSEPLSRDGAKRLQDVAFVALMTDSQELKARGAQALETVAEEVAAGKYNQPDDLWHSYTLAYLSWSYDWLYNDLSPKVRQDVAKALMMLAEYSARHFGFNFSGNMCAFNNHAAWAIYANGLAGLAVAHDHPQGKMHAAFAFNKFTGAFFPALRLVAGENGIWNEGTHYNQVMLKPTFLFMEAARSATGEDLFAEEPWVKSTATFWPYITHPDGSMVMFGDWWYQGENLYPVMYSRVFPIVAKAASETGDPFLQDYARNILSNIDLKELEPWHVAWFNPKVKSKPLAQAPTSRLFQGQPETGGEELAVLRSGWDEDARIITLAGGDWFGHHDHYNAGAFTVFYRGDLAIDPGYVPLDEEANFQFYRRTIAHNSVLIDDEQAAQDVSETTWGFDGGQRAIVAQERPRNVDQYMKLRHPDYPEVSLFETGDVVEFQTTDTYDYVAVDITKAYRKSQVTKFVRHLVFVKPDLLLIYDEIETPSDKSPRWLLQSVNPPEIASTSFAVQNGGGQLHAQVLEPAGARLEFFTRSPDSSPRQDFTANPIYRTEVVAPTGAEHEFLILMHISDSTVNEHPQAVVHRTNDGLEVEVSGPAEAAAGNSLTIRFPFAISSQ